MPPPRTIVTLALVFALAGLAVWTVIALPRARIVVTLNGTKVADFNMDGSRPVSGHIGLQNHTGRVQFRNIQIKSLA